MLLEIRNDVNLNSLNNKFDNLSQQVNDLKIRKKGLKDQNAKLENTVSILTEKLTNVENTLSDQIKKQERLESLSRKSDLKFYDVEGDRDESPEESEHKVRDLIGNTLGVDCSNTTTERVHRIPSRTGTRPILVQFTHYKDRLTVLKAFRQKRRDTELPIRVSEDL